MSLVVLVDLHFAIGGPTHKWGSLSLIPLRIRAQNTPKSPLRVYVSGVLIFSS